MCACMYVCAYEKDELNRAPRFFADRLGGLAECLVLYDPTTLVVVSLFGPKAMLRFYCSTLSSPLVLLVLRVLLVLLLLLAWFCIGLVAWLLVIVFRRRFEFARVYHAPSHFFFSSAVMVLVAACTTCGACGACGICRIYRIDGICRISRIRTTRRLWRHGLNWSDCSYSRPCLAHLQP